MNLVKCENGHFYDSDLHDRCDICFGGGDNKTMPVDGGVGEFPFPDPSFGAPAMGSGTANLGRTEPLQSVGLNVAGGTIPLSSPVVTFQAGVPDEGKTMPVIKKAIVGDDKEAAQNFIDPVVGWLVSVGGAQKGQDYRLHDGYNDIGRGSSNYVVIKGDDQISRDRQAQVIYDGQSRSFFFVAGEGRNVLRLNGQLALKGNAIPLKAYDVIQMGETTLVFIPLCGDNFDWTDAM